MCLFVRNRRAMFVSINDYRMYAAGNLDQLVTNINKRLLYTFFKESL